MYENIVVYSSISSCRQGRAGMLFCSFRFNEGIEGAANVPDRGGSGFNILLF